MQKRTTNDIMIEHIPGISNEKNKLSPYLQIKHNPSDAPINHFHFHDSLEIGYCYEGSGIFVVDGEILPFSANDATIIFKNQIHIAQSEHENLSKWKFVFIYPEQILSEFPVNETSLLISSIITINDLSNILTKEKYPKIVELIANIINEIDEAKTGYNSYVKLLIMQLLFEIARLNGTNTNPNELYRQSLIQITPALEYISCNYMHEISIPTLAEICFTSERNLRRLFKKAFSLSPHEFIVKYRIKMSTIFLANRDTCILDVSNNVGFSSVSSFNRHFRSLMNMSPSQWLKKQ